MNFLHLLHDIEATLFMSSDERSQFDGKQEEALLRTIYSINALPSEMSKTTEAALLRILEKKGHLVLYWIYELVQDRLCLEDAYTLMLYSNEDFWNLNQFETLMKSLFKFPESALYILRRGMERYPAWRSNGNLFCTCVKRDLRAAAAFSADMFEFGLYMETVEKACQELGPTWTKTNGPFFAFMPGSLMRSHRFCLSAACYVDDSGATYALLDPPLRECEDIAVAFCRHQSGVLQQTGELRAVPRVVLAALANNGYEILYAKEFKRIDYLARAVATAGPSFLSKSPIGLGAKDDINFVIEILGLSRLSMKWSSLELLPHLSARLRSNYKVVGAIFQHAGLSMREIEAEIWANTSVVLEAWGCIPPEAFQYWPHENGSPKILLADPRLCYLIPDGLTHPRVALAIEGFSTAEWIDATPEVLAIPCAQKALLNMGAALFHTNFWLRVQKPMDVLNTIPSMGNMVKLWQGAEGFLRAELLWQTTVARTTLQQGPLADEWSEAEHLWRLIINTGVPAEKLFVAQPLCVILAPGSVSDEVILALAEADPQNMRLFQVPPPDLPLPSGPRRRRANPRSTTLAMDVLRVVGAENWNILPTWMQKASGYEHFECCICMSLPVCKTVADEVRRCPGGHLICSKCLKEYDRDTCPICRALCVVNGIYGRSFEYDFTMLNRIA